MFTMKLTQWGKIFKVHQPLSSDQPLLSGHLPFPQGWPLNRGLTVPLLSIQPYINAQVASGGKVPMKPGGYNLTGLSDPQPSHEPPMPGTL